MNRSAACVTRFLTAVALLGIHLDVSAGELQISGAAFQFDGEPFDMWGIRTASFRDPGGHIWEIAR